MYPYAHGSAVHNSQNMETWMSIESVMPSNHLSLCWTLLLPPSIFPSIRVFSNESVLHIRWPKYWSFSFSISPSNEYSGLISFRMDWLDLHAVQGTLKSLLQHHSSKALILRYSAFWSHHFMANRWGNNGNSEQLYFGGLQKSLLTVTAAMKLKDVCSLEETLWPN